MTQPTPPVSRSQTARNNLIGVLVVGLLLVGIAAVLSFRQMQNMQTATPTPTQPPYGVIPVDPPIVTQDFSLPASTGGSLSQSDLKGKYTMLFFGYTHCPDFCPTTLANWKMIKQALGTDGAKINWIFVSVDGARDTPEVMQRYLSRFDPDFVGLTGNDAVLRKIGTDYGLDYTLHTEEGENYSVDHTTRQYLLDPQAQIVDEFAFDSAQADVVSVIQQALAKGSA
ncbi:MAG: redoxin domain-containing protein [Chloroflexi bacterium]|nr:redoxin domain-containing protein [Chloroflexota bacterium]